MNKKQLLADFYLALLSVPVDNLFRLMHQELYASVRNAMAIELNENAEVVQRIFERMLQEDK
jgi:hypothetical protein